MVKRVLLVDDDERNLKILSTLVRQEGYEVNTAPDGLAALETVKPWRPDLILMDVMMPGIDGFETTRRLKADKATASIPVIMLTALTDRESRLAGLEAGAEEFLNKPVDRLELGIRLRNLLRLKEYSDFLAHHNELLETQVAARTKEVWEMQLEVMSSLGRAAEYRDNETGMHIIRMSRYSQMMGLAVGMTDDRAELLLHASPMHDIGKVGTPDYILLKPGKLTVDEWKIMQTHTTVGHKILSSERSCDLIEMAKLIAVSHHEKWDGSGYPSKLKGTDIPLEARIVALADVFDALTSERPYKKAWSVEDAVAEIEKQRDRHFESRLVDVFLELLPDMLVVKAENQEEPDVASGSANDSMG